MDVDDHRPFPGEALIRHVEKAGDLASVEALPPDKLRFGENSVGNPPVSLYVQQARACRCAGSPSTHRSAVARRAEGKTDLGAAGMNRQSADHP